MTKASDPSDLYGLPLERFTAERTALAKRLRQEGRRDQASEVSKLRKPSAAAWAVNQLVRTQKREVDALLKAGDTLVRVQADLLSGRGDSRALRDAAEAERAAVDVLVDRARGLLSAVGVELSAARLEQVRETLQAAALDEDVRAQVGTACLERELRHIGLGSLAGGTSPARGKTARKDDHKRRAAEAAAARKAAAQTERRRQLEATLRETEQAVDAVREDYERALRAHERAQRALDELTER